MVARAASTPVVRCGASTDRGTEHCEQSSALRTQPSAAGVFDDDAALQPTPSVPVVPDVWLCCGALYRLLPLRLPSSSAMPKKAGKGGAASRIAPTPPARPFIPLPSSPAELEHVLTQLLAPDTAQITAATAVLNEVLKQPTAIPPLLHQLISSTSAEARQMAAVLLRRRIKQLWTSTPNDIKAQLKPALLHRLTHEPVRIVRRSVAALIARVAQQTAARNQWPQLLDFLFQCTRSTHVEHREIGLLLFRALAENIPSHLQPHLATLQRIFVTALADPEDRVRIEALYALDALVDLVDPEEEKAVMTFSSTIPPLVSLVSSYLVGAAVGGAAPQSHDSEEVVSVVLEVFDSLTESPAPVLDPHLSLITPLMLSVLTSPAFDLNLRDHAAVLLKSIVTAKPKKITRLGLVPSLLSSIPPLLCDPSDHTEDEDSPQHIGADLLDAVALNLPKKLTYTPLMDTASRLLQSGGMGEVKGGLVIIAVVAEAFADLISPILDSVLTPVLSLTSHPARPVRTAAWVAISQLAVHCDDAFLHYHRLVLPPLLRALGGDEGDAAVREKACFALEVFSDAIAADDLTPYLGQLMEKLLHLLCLPDLHTQTSSLLAIKNIAGVAGRGFLPYFPPLVPLLARLIQLTDDAHLTLRCHATECVGFVAEAVGKDAFASYLPPFLQQVMHGMTLDYFELRESSYRFFSKLCLMLQEDFGPLLTTVLPLVLATLTSDEGMSVTGRAGGLDEDDDGDEYNSELEEDDGGEEEDEEAMARRLNFSIRTGALDEKVAALECLSFILSTQTMALAPFVDRVALVMEDLLDFMHPSVREAVTTAAFDWMQWHHRVYPVSAPVKGQLMTLTPEHSKVLEFIMPTQAKRLAEEDDREVSKAMLELIEAAIRLYGFAALRDCHKPLQKQLLLLLKEKATCQRPTDDEGDEEVSEHDVVLDHTCEVLAALAQVGGAELYGPMLKEHAPLLLKFTEAGREPSSRGMAIGCFAEIGQEVGWTGLGQWVERVVKVAVRGMEDVSMEVRRNSTFCVAILITAGGAAMTAQWPAIISAVEKLMLPPTPGMYGRQGGGAKAEGGHRVDSKEEKKEERLVEQEQRVTDEDHIGCRDNAASVLARLLATASALNALPSVPFDRLLALLLQVLPLTVDQQEAKPVYSALIGLYRTAAPQMAPYTPRVLHVMAQVFGNPEVDVAVQRDMIAFCQALMEGNREAVERVVGEMGEKERERFIKFVVHSAEVEGKKEGPAHAVMAGVPSHAQANGHTSGHTAHR